MDGCALPVRRVPGFPASPPRGSVHTVRWDPLPAGLVVRVGRRARPVSEGGQLLSLRRAIHVAIAVVVLAVGVTAPLSPAAANHDPPACTVGGDPYRNDPPRGSYVCQHGVTKITGDFGYEYWLVVGTDWQHQVYYSKSLNGGPFTAWKGIGGTATSPVFHRYYGPFAPEIVVKGTDEKYWCNRLDGSNWYSGGDYCPAVYPGSGNCWENGLGKKCGWGSAVAWTDGHWQQFVVGTDYHVYTRYERWNGSGWVYSAWYRLGGNAWSGVWVRHLDAQTVIISVLGTDNRLYCLQGGHTAWQSTWTTSACPKNYPMFH